MPSEVPSLRGPTLQDVRKAAERIRPYAHRTPVITCHGLNQRLGATLFLKCENLQRGGCLQVPRCL